MSERWPSSGTSASPTGCRKRKLPVRGATPIAVSAIHLALEWPRPAHAPSLPPPAGRGKELSLRRFPGFPERIEVLGRDSNGAGDAHHL